MEEKGSDVGLLKVVNDLGLREASQQGWELVERYQEKDGWNNGDGSFGGSTKTLFLMQLNEGNSIAELTKEIAKLQDKVKGFGEAHREDREELEALKYKLSSATREIDQLTGEKERWQEAMAAHSKMESDLGKIQAVIGLERMNEILGGEV